LKSVGNCSGVALANAASSRARDHRLFGFESKAGKVASISVLTGLVFYQQAVVRFNSGFNAVRIPYLISAALVPAFEKCYPAEIGETQ
jgi:hypothetical protein